MHYKYGYFEDRPHIPVALQHADKRARFLPLLDSGADFSIFYKSDAIRLGLDWDKGRDGSFINADGGSFCAKIFKLNIEIEGFKFLTDICFADNSAYAMPLLGRKDIFEKFFITICEKEKYVELKNYEN